MHIYANVYYFQLVVQRKKIPIMLKTHVDLKELI